MKITSEPTFTNWGNYEIVIRTGTSTLPHLAGDAIASYEVFRNGRLLIVGVVPAGFRSTEEAAESALRIAKLDARESLDGPFPSY